MPPRRSQKASAMYSAVVKRPGEAGRNFIRTSAKGARAPKKATMLSFFRDVDGGAAREITRRGEAQAASQPKAEAAEPTSVTGTRRTSPRKSAAKVPAAMMRTALLGVWNCG